MQSATSPENATEYQTVTIILSDDRKGTFVGPVLVREEDTKVCIKDVQFGFPQPLPQGAKFAPINEG